MPAVSAAQARARAALVAVDSYELFLDLTGVTGSRAEPVRSRVTIRFRCAEPGAATFADVRVAVTGSAVLNGVPLDAPVDGRLALAGLAADNTLTVEAQAPPEQALTLFTDPLDGTGYAQVVCYPAMAPELFCCFDQPDLPAAMSLSVAAPADWECVANGAVTDREQAGGASVWRFATVPGMKPMELALVAGPLAGTRPASGRVAMSVRCRASLVTSTSGHLGHLERFGGGGLTPAAMLATAAAGSSRPPRPRNCSGARSPASARTLRGTPGQACVSWSRTRRLRPRGAPG